MNPETPVAPPLDPRAWVAAIIESSDDAIASKTLDGIVTTWNAGAERIFGYTAAEMVGQSILKIIPPDRHHEEDMILSRMRQGERIDHFETVRQRKDGTLIEISVTVSPIRDANGKVIGISKIARDITIQKRYLREIAAAWAAAEEAKKIAESANQAKDHFLSILSHELRTPLTPALAAISFVEKDPDVSESVREHLSMIRRNVETEARLVDDLLDLTRISRGKISLHFEAVDAHAVIHNVVAMFQQDIDEKAIAVTTALHAREHHVWADPGRFQQVLLNLLSNAVKFTPRQGTITVRTNNVDSHLRVEVTDTGVGIEPSVMPRLFNAFEQGERTVTRQFGGLGLGLSIVKSLVDMHKGSVTASSLGKNKGSSFSVTIPIAPTGKTQSQSSSSGNGKPRVKCNRVLLVEDHADTRKIMSKLLTSFGCQVSTTATVKEAIELASQQTFDLLICDFGLPDGTGAEVMRYISERQHVKGIAITGFGHDDDIRRSHEAGFSVHLTKPINLDMLAHAIEEAAD